MQLQRRYSHGLIEGRLLHDHALAAFKHCPVYKQTLNPAHDMTKAELERPWLLHPGLATACEYPVGRNGLTWVFCGNKIAAPGKSYCRRHMTVCYISRHDPRER